MSNDVVLSSALRTNLLSLQTTQNSIDKVQNILATGLKVSSALDNPANFFAARSLNTRASGFSAILDGIGQASQAIQQADKTVTAVTKLYEQLSSVLDQVDAGGDATTLEAEYDLIRGQIDDLIGDSAFGTANLLEGDTLTTKFNADGSSTLDTAGTDLTTTGLAVVAAGDFTVALDIAAARTDVDEALASVAAFGSSLATDLTIIETRQEFTKQTISNLQQGADKLTLADQNEEAAKLLSLQTRQQLGVTALSLASQAQQSVLRLF